MSRSSNDSVLARVFFMFPFRTSDVDFGAVSLVHAEQRILRDLVSVVDFSRFVEPLQFDGVRRVADCNENITFKIQPHVAPDSG